jgi:hypothetical protein
MPRPLTCVCKGPVMDGEPSRLGSAQVRWNDYVGTSAADDADALLDTRSLYEIVGLDRDRWMIVGIDFSLAASAEQVVVYATDRSLTVRGEPLDEGSLPVTAFHLGTSVRLDGFLKEVFKRVSVRLLSTVVEQRELVVTEHANLGAASTS